MDQTDNRPPNSDQYLFSWYKFVFGYNFEEALGLPLSAAAERVIDSCHINPFCCTSQSKREAVRCCSAQEKTTLENDDFKGLFGVSVVKSPSTNQNSDFSDCDQLMRHPLIELSHLSSLLQMPNDCRMVDVEFFGNFLCSCKRISFDDGCHLPMAGLHAPHLQGPRLLCKTS